jgi:hypothetical protein
MLINIFDTNINSTEQSVRQDQELWGFSIPEKLKAELQNFIR